MRDYQPKRNNPYKLPQHLYREVKYILKDYDRLCADLSAMQEESEECRDWARLCTTAQKIAAIRSAFEQIPHPYRKGIRNNLKYENSKDGYYPPNADFRTYQTYKQRLIYYTAKELHYV